MRGGLLGARAWLIRWGAILLLVTFEGRKLLGIKGRVTLRPGLANPSLGGRRPGTGLAAALLMGDVRWVFEEASGEKKG